MNRRLRAALVGLAAVAAFATAAAQEKGEELVVAAEGFKLEVPRGPWAHWQYAWSPSSEMAVHLQRTDSAREVSFTVYVIDAGDMPNPKSLRDDMASRWSAASATADVTRGEERLAPGETPFLRFKRTAADGTSTITLHLLVNGVRSLLLLQTVAPSDDDHEAELARIRASFALVPVENAAARVKLREHRRLASRCGRHLEWASSWKAAAARAAETKRLVLVAVERFRGIALMPQLPSSTLMDEDVSDLVRTRFVVLYWAAELEAPFLAPEKYGLGPSTFGQGLLVVTPDGTVVADAPTGNPTAVDELLRETLAAHPEASGPAFDAKDPEVLLRRGDLAAAERLLEHPETAEQWRLRAVLLRRLRRGEEAREALERAKELGADVRRDEGLLLLRMGRFLSAEDVLDSRLKEHPTDVEARYWHALARAYRCGLEPVRAELEAIAASPVETRWSWRAAALLVGLGAATGQDPPAWPDAAALAIVKGSPPEPLEAGDAARAEEDAVSFLLAHQAKDGSWPSPVTLVAPRSSSDVALAALAGTALLPYREREPVAEAIARTLELVVQGPLAPRSGAMFDHAVWSQVFALRFLARCRHAQLGDRERIESAMVSLIAALGREQLASGGWSYFLVGSADPSISFVTAAALCALEDASAVGVAIDEKVVERARGALKAARRDDGSFAYMTGANERDERTESALRSPLGAFALVRAGAGDAVSVQEALGHYLRHRRRVRAERGKALCHTGPEGTASYYLLFGYAFAAEAVLELPQEKRARYRTLLLEDVLALRTKDGAFCDNPGIGRCYGAAMGLRTLALLRGARFY